MEPISALNALKNEKKDLINFNTFIELIWKRDPSFIEMQEEIINKFPMKVYSVKFISEFEYRIFGKSNNVIVGLDGYLTDKVVAQQLITLDEMDSNILRESASRLSVINQYLAKQNKKFIVVIVPLKPTIYGEKYPGPLAERKNIGLVQQDIYLFAGTVLENIRYGKPDAAEEEIIAAAKQANAHDFIMALPNGYSTDIGQRGVKLSGGQKQRLSIARAFLKNPPIIIFDEATSSLDNESERAVQNSLERLMKNRTTLVIFPAL